MAIPTNQRGLTLLELLIALAIAAILALAQVAPFQRTIASRDRAEATMERSSMARTTLSRIAEELNGAVALPPNAAGETPASFELVDRTLDHPASELSFFTTAARRLSAGPQDPIELVRYRLEPSPDDPRTRRLIKEQLPSVAPLGTAPTMAVMLEGVAGFRVRALPARQAEWLDQWSAAGTSAPPAQGAGGASAPPTSPALPVAVALELSLADGTETPPVHRLTVTLPMATRRRS